MKKTSFFLLHFFITNCVSISTATQYTLKLDPLFSVYAHHQFAACLQELEKLNVPFSVVMQLLQEAFPVIAHLQAQVIAKDCTKIICKAAHPVARSSQDLVVLSSLDRVKKEFFVPEVIANIIAVKYKNDAYVVDPSYIHFVKNNTMYATSGYGMEWNDAHHIEITSSSQKVLLVADHQTILSQDLFNAYEYVLQDLVQNKLINKKKKWIVDIRFSNQIVVYEGGTYEKSIRT